MAEMLEKKAAKRRVYTAEELANLNAGLELLAKLGLEEKALKVLKVLVPAWYGEDKEALKEAKTEIQTEFGGADKFKEFINGDFREALAPYAGIVKIIPVANNIATFYAHRATTSKKSQVVSIAGEHYRVNSAYLASLAADMPTEERRQLLLSHPDTKKIENNNVIEL